MLHLSPRKCQTLHDGNVGLVHEYNANEQRGRGEVRIECISVYGMEHTSSRAPVALVPNPDSANPPVPAETEEDGLEDLQQYTRAIDCRIKRMQRVQVSERK